MAVIVAKSMKAKDWTKGGRHPALPDWVERVYPHQTRAVREVVEEFATADVVMLDAPTGCLAGDTELVLNRGGRGFRMSIRDFYEKSHGRNDQGKAWDLSIPTKIAQGDIDNMILRSSLVGEVMYSGLKDTIVVTVWDDKKIRLTPDHRVMTPDGWQEVGNLQPGNQLLVNVGRRKRQGKASKLYYPQWGGLRSHPRASNPGHSKSGWVVPRHIIVMEAHLNGMIVGDYLAALRVGKTGFQHIPSTQHVHHLDEDTTNYQLSNLQVLEAEDHHRLHGDVSRVAEQLGYRAIDRITPGGMTMTFDIAMREGGEHFMAEGIYVHNSGKTLIGELVRREMDVDRGLYVCTTKSLQQQMLHSFPYARVLKGRTNYTPTKLTARERDGWRQGRDGRSRGVGVTCADCDAGPPMTPPEDQTCSYCEFVQDCPYKVARQGAMDAAVGVLNTSYLLAECNGPGKFRDRELVVCDEADLLERELLGFVEMRLPKRLVGTLGLEVPKKGSHMTTIRAWLKDECLPGLKDHRGQLRMVRGLDGQRDLRRVERVIEDVGRVVARENGWVREGDEEGDRSSNALVLKPVSVEDVAHKFLWRHGQKWLLMSGTTVSAEGMADSLGIEEAGLKWASVEVPMLFPLANRRIVYAPLATMTRKGQEAGGLAKVLVGIERVLARHEGDNVLIHSHTYALAKEISAHVATVDSRPTYTYVDAYGREDALAKFRACAGKGGAILVASSMDRGIDLPGDDCRVQVIVKCPLPSLGSRQVSERLRTPGGQLWYLMESVRTIMQASGRAVRGMDDWAVTYILDAHFSKMLGEGKRYGLFPQWWLDALELGRVKDYA